MSENRDGVDELQELLAALREDVITEAQAERLTSLLRESPEARQTYIRYMAIAAHLHGGGLDSVTALVKQQGISDSGERLADELPAVAAGLPVAVEAFGGFPSPLPSLGSFAFSYAAAAVIVGVGLLVGWACEVSAPHLGQQRFASGIARPAETSMPSRSGRIAVGRVNGTVECRWADPRQAPVGFDRIVIGQKYALISGLIEISYDSGAKVILQGPCSYEVESRTGGYLSFGRLTARVEKRVEGGRRKAEGNEELMAHGPSLKNNHQSSIINHQSPFPLPPSPLFFVRTPTATVADLGTEFGLEVDRSGASRTHVFKGKVELRVAGGDGKAATVVPLGEDESARVDVGQDRVAAVTRPKYQADPFVRQMPKRVRIKFFNTGVGLKVGSSDPHWEVHARSDDANFTPRQAIVSGAGYSMWLANQGDRSQWISVAVGESVVPDRVVYTFRTTFDLRKSRPSTAVLHGWFVVDNHIRAIRLNGREFPVPKHGPEEFGFFHSFSIDRGFVEGVNVLEFDVENGLPQESSPSQSPMGLLVELDGSVLSAWPEPSANTAHTEKQRN
jgi:hypothetical protein